MEGIIVAIALSSEAFYSMYVKEKTFSNPKFGNISMVGLLMCAFYLFAGFSNFEWYMPLLAVAIGGPIAAFIKQFIYIIFTDLRTTSIVEILFLVGSIIAYFN